MSDCQQNSPCCRDGFRTTLPDVLEAMISFTGVSVPGAFPDTTVRLYRKCPTAYLFSIGDQVVAADYVSDSVDLGLDYTARFAIAGNEFYYIESFGDNGDPSAARAFPMYVGFPMMKYMGANATCQPKIIFYSADFLGLSVQVSVFDSWSFILNQLQSAGFCQDHSLEWTESFPNGWEAATLCLANRNTFGISGSIYFEAKNLVTGACPSDTGFAIGLPFNSRMKYGNVVFGNYFNVVLDSYSSLYGTTIRRFLSTDPPSSGSPLTGAVAWRSVSPPESFLRGNAPYAAIVSGQKTRDAGGLFRATTRTLGLRARILATADSLVYPRPFIESPSDVACADCRDVDVIPTVPSRDDIAVPESIFKPIDHRVRVLDCPKTSQSMAMKLYDLFGSPPSGGYSIYNREKPGAVCNSKGVVEASIQVQELKNVWIGDGSGLPGKLSISWAGVPAKQTPSNVSATASASDVRAALLAIPGGSGFLLGPGDVDASGGPFPLPISLTFSERIASKGLSLAGGGFKLSRSSREYAHFVSEPGSEPDMNSSADGAIRYVGSSGMIQDSSGESVKYDFLPDDYSYMAFGDGALIKKATCTKNYTNCKYEIIAPTVHNVSFAPGMATDLFSPLRDLYGTLPVETSGVAPPSSSNTFYGGHTCSAGTDARQGKDGLFYRMFPGSWNSAGSYISSGGATSYLTTDGHQFSTYSDYADYAFAVVACNATLGGQSPPGAGSVGDIRGPSYVNSIGGTPWVSGTRNGDASLTLPGKIYQTFTQPPEACKGILSERYGDPINWPPGQSGVLPGQYTSLHYFGYRIYGSGLSIDSCSGEIRFVVRFMNLRYIRAPWTYDQTSEIWKRPFGNLSLPFVLDSVISPHEKSYYWYGYVEPRIATFRVSGVLTDSCLRPNIQKNRVISLALDSIVPGSMAEMVAACPGTFRFPPNLHPLVVPGAYVGGDRAFFSSWTTPQNGDAINLLQMPTPSQVATIQSGLQATAQVGAVVGSELYYSLNPPNSPSNSYRKEVLIANNSSVGTMIDPSSFPQVDAINFSSSSMTLRMEDVLGDHSITGCSPVFKYAFPDDFPAQWQGEHQLLSDNKEPQWVEELPVRPFVKAMLSPHDWSLTLFEEDCDDAGRREPRRVVARYRLPCNQCKRFDCAGVNTFELVSCDRSIANWPYYLEVYP